MRKLSLNDSHHPAIDLLLNNPELARREIDNHLEDIHPHPLRPITENSVEALMLRKQAFFGFYQEAFLALDGLPEPIRHRLRLAVLLLTCGENQPEAARRKAQKLADLLRQESQRFEEIAEQEVIPDVLDQLLETTGD